MLQYLSAKKGDSISGVANTSAPPFSKKKNKLQAAISPFVFSPHLSWLTLSLRCLSPLSWAIAKERTELTVSTQS